MTEDAKKLIEGLTGLGVNGYIVFTFGPDRKLDQAFSWGDDDVERTRMDRMCTRIMDRELQVATCRVCGCTDTDACFSKVDGRPCSWAEDDLCSLCAQELEKFLTAS